MTAPFAAFETATAVGAFAALANATASINGGAAVPVIFDAAYLDPLGIAGAGPVASMLSTDATGVDQGDSFVIGSTNYTVAAVEPDGTGVTVLRLQEV